MTYTYINDNMQAYSIFDSPPKPKKKKQRYFAGYYIIFPFIAPPTKGIKLVQ